jgi:hypothetical protein
VLVLLDDSIRLFQDSDPRSIKLESTEVTETPAVTHLGFRVSNKVFPAKLISQNDLVGHTMDKSTQTNLENLHSSDKELQNAAFYFILEATDKPVDWAYAVWDDLVKALSHKNNHERAIAAQVLCNLAKSDPESRMLRDFDKLLVVTKDERFVTARHCLQALWKVGLAGKLQQQKLVEGLETRFVECVAEKNGTLIRYDIIQDLRKLYDEIKDEKVREKSLELIETEEDLKYRKKYRSVWKAK